MTPPGAACAGRRGDSGGAVTSASHTTSLDAITEDADMPAGLTESREAVGLVNTRFDITPIGGEQYRVRFDHLERLAHHKRGRSSTLAFIISGDGLLHLFGAITTNTPAPGNSPHSAKWI